jgi:hypothetical protein
VKNLQKEHLARSVSINPTRKVDELKMQWYEHALSMDYNNVSLTISKIKTSNNSPLGRTSEGRYIYFEKRF